MTNKEDAPKITKCPPAYADGFDYGANVQYGFGKHRTSNHAYHSALSVSSTLAQLIAENKDKK